MCWTRRYSPDHGKLPRGQACFNCRRRKRKCDGNLPCSQCTHLNIEDDCEYTDGGKRSLAHVLQEDIDRLENRIHHLEHPHHTPKVHHALPLHQPYHGSPGSSTSRSSTPAPVCYRRKFFHTKNLSSASIDTFLPYSSEFGFFLDCSRFRNSALLPFQIGNHARPTPALLSAVYLWGLRLSGQPNLMTQEPAFLARALKLTSKGLSDTHPQRVMHTLQAEVLLSYFFFASGRSLEVSCFPARSTRSRESIIPPVPFSLSLSSSLHLIRSENQSSARILHPPADAVEEGERIQAWWTVKILDGCWAVGLCETPGFANRDSLAMVDTPWPLESDDYARGLLSPNTRILPTVVPTFDTGMSTVAMLAKASILWVRADELARMWKPGMPNAISAKFYADFKQLDTLIDPLPRLSAMTRTLVVAHSIAHAATVRLHSLFAHTDATAKRKRLAAARSVLGIIAAVPLRHFRYINPIMGTVWTAACGVFLEEIHALKALHRGPPREEELNLRAFLSRSVAAISAFEMTCPLLRSQISPMRESCGQIGITV
ncbi:Zn(2)-Cys(6) binuclear cluster domain-containing protein [Mycena olivaceomarginata]|nr:Zn(2)-Cys(6) binuclear cluster domain-containing protein [Mycena olivaceomarginata]